MKKRICIVCGETKPLSEFSHTSKYLPCKACEEGSGHGSKNHLVSGKIACVPEGDRLLMSIIRERLNEAKRQARKYASHPIPDIDEVYLYRLFKAQAGLCALLGYKMVIERKHPLCPSLGQIEPGQGYRAGNVQWVTRVANRAKGDLSTEDFYRMCELALAHRDAKSTPDQVVRLPDPAPEA